MDWFFVEHGPVDVETKPVPVLGEAKTVTLNINFLLWNLFHFGKIFGLGKEYFIHSPVVKKN
jgi:hypothetical protein